jgi:hypothetical protein
MLAVSLLLTTFGIWIALRRHPLYTWPVALRIAGGTLLLILANAGGILLAVWLALSLAPPAQSDAALFAAIICALPVMALGMTYGFTLITPPSARPETRLPPTITPVNVHRRALRPWWRPALAFVGLCALIALIPGPSREIAVGLALTAFIPASIGIPAWYLTARQRDRTVTALQLNPWLHWHYSKEARAAWIDVQIRRLHAAPSTKYDWRMVWCVCCPVSIALVMVIADGPWITRAALGLGFSTLVIGVVKICQIVERGQPDRVERRMRTAAPDAYFGHDGVFCDDRFLPWLSTNQYLTRATVDQRVPRCVALEFKKITVGGYSMMTLWQDVLIPETANDADLERLQTELRSRCPSAHVQIL